jgi:transcriptional regulator with AAA-type ATPase domain
MVSSRCFCAQIVSAARDPQRKPVLVFGEPGLCKDNIAALLHFGGPDKFRVMVQVGGG